MKFWLSRYDPPPIPIFRQALKQRGDCARADVFGEGVVSCEQLLELSKLCELLALEQSDTPETHAAEAAALAHELFPPMAKALAWEFFDGCWIAGPYTIDKNRWHYRDEETHVTPTAEGFFIDIKAQKTECETHHQAKFKEQLA